MPITDLACVAAEIRHVERATGSTATGRAGERGPYQLTRAVWSQHTTLPYSLADDEPTARIIAVTHLSWLAEQLAAHGLEATTYNLALAYNAGLTAAVHGRAKERQKAYAQRVTNLFYDARRSNEPVTIILK